MELTAEEILKEIELEAIALAETNSSIKLANRSLMDFVLYHDEDYQNLWFHELISKSLDSILDGKINRLIINIPPRHGKSHLVSRYFPAYILGKNPNKNIILASHTDSFSKKINKDVQRIIDSKRFKNVFPETKLFGSDGFSRKGGTYTKNKNELEVVGKTGTFRNVGVGGSITGEGGDIIIVDDPIKSWEDAMSPTIRAKIIDWFDNTLMTRLSDMNASAIIIVMTRWHDEDLSGVLRKRFQHDPENNDEYKLIKLAALRGSKANDDSDPRRYQESLWEKDKKGNYKFPKHKLLKLKNSRPRTYANLYEQEPVPEGGELFKESWWKFYDRVPLEFEEIIQTWDLSFGSLRSDSSYVCGQIWGRSGANHFLLDLIRERMSYKETKENMKYWNQKWSVAVRKLVENKANGPAVISDLHNSIPGLIPIEPKGSKYSRAIVPAEVVESGNIFLPKPSRFPWSTEFILEAKRFRGLDNEKNDQVDAFTQYINDYLNRTRQNALSDEDFFMNIDSITARF